MAAFHGSAFRPVKDTSHDNQDMTIESPDNSPIASPGDIEMTTNGDPSRPPMQINPEEALTQGHRRRRSFPPPIGASQSSPYHVAPRRLSLMDFGSSGDGHEAFPISRSQTGTDFLEPELAQSSGAFDQPGDILALEGISPDLMSNMMPASFANMTVTSLVSNSGTLGLLGSQVTPNYPHGSIRTSRNGVGAGMDIQEMSLDSKNATSADDIHRDCTRLQTLGPSISGVDPQGAQTRLAQGDDNHAHDQISYENSRTALRTALRPHLPQPSGLPKALMEDTTSASRTLPRAISRKERPVYSKSGFDMLRALWYVATRKDPEIHIGAVDMSCAFVVCDVTMNDCPIVYVSDSFQNLTGYSCHEIVGQNCRFLQAPDGKVEAGVKREFVDDSAVYTLKQKISARREVQQSLINYRKGGKPFLNLLTMIPIPWDTEETRYFVGFQIDLVECPEAISSAPETGGVQVDYKHSEIGQYIWEPPRSSHWAPDHGQTLGIDDVSTLLQQYISKGGLASDWHRQSWHKMLLENVDDVIHVISLKGVFQYVSPSAKRVLEYDGTELVGSPLSSVCHPSDIVPVTRELKDATVDMPVNLVFRIRRKRSGYMWFESHGSLFSEQGKGRKCIILVGRRRPVYSLKRSDVQAHGGSIGDSELWAKVSTSGMFLFVSSNAKALLDLQPEALLGTSIHDLMRKESRAEFGRTIEKARRGKIVSCKHEVHNRRGQVLRAQTFLYPEETIDNKPSFLLAQIRLIKASSRALGHMGDQDASVERSIPSLPGGADAGSHSTDSHSPASGTSIVDDIMFPELGTTKCSSWQFELRQMEKVNRILAEELSMLLTNKKKRKRRKGAGNGARDCANCHTRNTPEWRRGPSGQRDLCNSCGLRWAKQVSHTLRPTLLISTPNPSD